MAGHDTPFFVKIQHFNLKSNLITLFELIETWVNPTVYFSINNYKWKNLEELLVEVLEQFWSSESLEQK